MKLRNLTAGAMLLAVGATAGAMCTMTAAGLGDLPAQAAELKTTLIDKDFELALKNHFEKRFFERIKATDEQKDKISTLLTTRMNETRPMREEMRTDCLQFVKLLSADTGDNAISEKAHSLQEQRNKLMDERLITLLKVRAVLTLEQRQQIGERLTCLITSMK